MIQILKTHFRPILHFSTAVRFTRTKRARVCPLLFARKPLTFYHIIQFPKCSLFLLHSFVFFPQFLQSTLFYPGLANFPMVQKASVVSPQFHELSVFFSTAQILFVFSQLRDSQQRRGDVHQEVEEEMKSVTDGTVGKIFSRA